MGIFSAAEQARNVLFREEPLTHIGLTSVFGKSGSKALDDGDNEIFGFIPNPGNTVSTVFGVPVGTQFGTAFGMEGWGALAMDIITDPTTWLSVGAIATGVAAPAGAAGLGVTLAKHGIKFSQAGVKMSKLKKHMKYLDGMSIEAKTKKVGEAFQLAAKAAENPELVKRITTAAELGDTKGMFKAVEELQAASLQNRFYKLGPDAVFDVQRVVDGTGLSKLKEAFEAEQILKASSDDLFSFTDEAMGALRYGFVGPKFLSKGVDILNTLPGAELLARGTSAVTGGVGKAIDAGMELTGLQTTKKAVMDHYYKHSAIVGAAKKLGLQADEIAPRVEFHDNGSIIKLAENAANASKASTGGFRLMDRLYKSELDVVAGMGNAGRALSNTLENLRTSAESKTGAIVSQLWKVGGRKSGIRHTLEEKIGAKLGGKKREELLDQLSMMKQGDDYDAQVQTLEIMLQTDGIPLNELHRYLMGGDLADTARAALIRKRIPGVNRALKYAGDTRFIPSKATQNTFETMKKHSELVAQAAESIGLPRFQVTKALAGMDPLEIKKLKPDGTFQALRSENGGVMFSPHTGLADEKRLAEIEHELAREEAYNMMHRGEVGRDGVEDLANQLIEKRDMAHLLRRDEAFKLLKAETNMTLHTSGNFSRQGVGLPGYAADPLSDKFKSEEFWQKWMAYHGGMNQAITNHAGITRVVNRVGASEYAEILARQGIDPAEAQKILAANKSGQFDVTVADQMIDDIVRETGDVRAGAKARNLIEKYLGNHVKADSIPYLLAAQINKFQITTKLTAVMSALNNLGQIGNVIVDSGFKTGLKAAKLAFDDVVRGVPGIADEIGTLAHNSVKDLDQGLHAFGGFTDTVLEYYGFSTIERFNRRMSTYAGLLTAEAMEKSLGVTSTKKGWESFWGQYPKLVGKLKDSYAKPGSIRAQLKKAKIPSTKKEADIINAGIPDVVPAIEARIDDQKRMITDLQETLGERVEPYRNAIGSISADIDALRSWHSKSGAKSESAIRDASRRIVDLEKRLMKDGAMNEALKLRIQNLQKELGQTHGQLMGAQSIQSELQEYAIESKIRSIDEIEEAIKAGTFHGFTKAEVRHIATETVNIQQFRTQAIDVAEAFNNPLGAFVGLFMKFQYKQSEFFIKNVATPGMKYIASGGKEGNIAPLLLTLSVTGPVIGEILMDLKSALNDRERPEDLGMRLWEDYLAVGGAGLFTQAAEPFVGGFNPFKAQQLAGTNLNDLRKYVNALGMAMTPGGKDDGVFWDELMKDLTHPLPMQLRDIPRGFLRNLSEDPESRQTKLEYDRFKDQKKADEDEEMRMDLGL